MKFQLFFLEKKWFIFKEGLEQILSSYKQPIAIKKFGNCLRYDFLILNNLNI